MKPFGILASVALLLGGPCALALEAVSLSDCREPQMPATVPDGDSADFAAMKVSHDLYATFNQDGNAYLTCLERNAQAQRQAATVAYGFGDKLNSRLQQIDSAYLLAYNGFVDRLHAMAERYNVELRKFKARVRGARGQQVATGPAAR